MNGGWQMKKHWIVAILLTIAFVLSGCGEVTLEEKIAQVREDNTITVQDVIDLMKLEGLEVEKMTPSSEFQSRWPNGEVVKINDTHYMALQAFEENLNQRTYTLFETKWQSDRGFSSTDANNEYSVTHQLATDYLHTPEGWHGSHEWRGKNLVALMVFDYQDNLSELSKEEVTAVLEEITHVNDLIAKVFYHDINNLVTEEIVPESDNFKITGTLRYYQTGVVDEQSAKEWTYYDAKTWLDYDVVCSDAVWEQYEGAAYEVKLEHPEKWHNGKRTTSSRGTLDYEDKIMFAPNGETDDILWAKAEGAPVYVLTITIGDITEIFRLDPMAE